MTFGKRLKHLRTLNELTQESMAEKLRISRSNISKYEKGILEPNIEIINDIADYFDVTTDYLLGKTDEPSGKGVEINKTLMVRIKELREKHKLTQTQLAAIANTGRPNISMFESGKCSPSIHIVAKLAAFFDVSTDYLLGMVDDPHEQRSILIPKEDLPPEMEELKKYVDYVGVFKETDLKRFTPEQLKKLIDFAKSIKGIE